MSAVPPFPEQTGGGLVGPGASGPLVIASNRLPVRWDDRTEQWVRSSGGLVTALEPVVARTGGVWVGWADGPEAPRLRGIDLRPVDLDPDEVDEYYAGYANATLWPAFHDAIEPVEFEPRWWAAYRVVNRRFADALCRSAPMGATVWVHDYHLCLVPRLVRERRPDLRLGFFLHTPWPSLAVATDIPHVDELLRGLEGADLLGFQRSRDEARFRALLSSRYQDGLPPVRTGVFPISVDADHWARLVADPVVRARAQRIRSGLDGRRRLLLGVDRMDYSKGILQRLDALGRLFDQGRVQPDQVRMLQIAVPSRQSIPAYRRLRDDVVARVRELNERHGRPGDPVVQLEEESAGPRELAALYLAADVAVVTPRRDGMNLVAKEFCAAQTGERPGVLVLGRGAGAADELSEAVLVDGSDPSSVADGLERALAMGPLARRALADRLRRIVRTRDLAVWTARFLEELDGLHLRTARLGAS
jgi:trehalose 6-phosphate synthase